ncbi:hypothetical protein JCM1841_003496 [Sporobolomyces salmonicolor]
MIYSLGLGSLPLGSDAVQLDLDPEAAASSAKDRTSSFSKPTKYAPVRPDSSLSSQAQSPTPSALPTPAQRRAQSTVIQHHAALNRPPPPPKRADWSTPIGPTAPGTAPAPARKPAALAPPAPPPRTPSSASSLSSASDARPVPAPPYQYATSQGLSAAPAAAVPDADLSNSLDARLNVSGDSATARQKKFSEYTDVDKQEMFAALDTFFGAKLGSASSSSPSLSPTPRLRASEPMASPPPPPVALTTRPRLPTGTSSSPSPLAPTSASPSSFHGASYPPAQSHSSSALSLLHYLLHTPFPTPWFASSSSSSSLPPPLAGRSDVRTSASWVQCGDTKQLLGVALSGDASIAWWRLTWTGSAEARGTAQDEVQREARYRPVPAPADGAALHAAHELYGPRLARFAREAVARGAPVGRGECWDLAHEALEAIKSEGGGRSWAPFPSVGRTHGRRLFYAKAAQGGETYGRWEGGDPYVREGDIVEWRKVRISEEGAPSGSWSLLGDPDHTAIVLAASPPRSLPSLSAGLVDPAYPLAALGALTVVEQSLGQVPQTRTYDLGAMSEGEVWIYRPAALRDVVGVEELRAEWPDDAGIECWSVGELE